MNTYSTAAAAGISNHRIRLMHNTTAREQKLSLLHYYTSLVITIPQYAAASRAATQQSSI